ncbi:MAG: peptidase S8, partial [Sphingobacteriales bacterium]
MYTNISKAITAPFLAGALFISLNATAQTIPAPAADLPKDWHLLDLQTDGFYGISLKPAYQLIKGKRSNRVTVATIDSGIDTAQKDLRSVLWTNAKEIAGNGKDDDKNGYIDDVHGWNFLGGPGGKANYTETSEEVREYNRLKPKYSILTEKTAGDKKEYAYWLKVKTLYDTTVNTARTETEQLVPILNVLMTTSGYIKRELKLPAQASFTMKDIDNLQPVNDTLMHSKQVWESIFQQVGGNADNASLIKDWSESLAKYNNDLNPDLASRKRIVGDDPDIWDTKPYGNALLKFPDAMHGTGVAGLIGAVRNNGYGVDGVADNVRIMAIKTVPNGDEYDKDVAKAIRYAVDNGARIVNMSFGKN